ncbi:LysE/ArgO family amino acid transporter [Micrococcus sp.]|uniref:LysE/ArgO family amino acid transporter n=1 Tax=Micrococcus sp. TaxID=1271 RepID=UPI002A91C33A|nr:LysE family transporter [Micrococcus sp.]MDY6055043.1 LysE family transporter [Micrococcus sp.]
MTALTSAFSAGFLTYLALVVAIGAQTLFLLRQVVRREHAWTALGVCFVADIVLLAVGAAGLGVAAESAPWLVTAMTAAGVVYLVLFAAGTLRSAVRGGRSLSSAAAAENPEIGPSEADVVALTGRLPVIDPATGRLPGRDGGTPSRGPRTPAGGPVRPAAAARPSRGTTATLTRVRPAAGVVARPQASKVRVVLLALSVSLLNPHAILDAVVMMGTFAQSFGEATWSYAAGAMAASAVWFGALGWGGEKLAPLMDSPRVWRAVDAVVGVLMLALAVKLGLGLL